MTSSAASNEPIDVSPKRTRKSGWPVFWTAFWATIIVAAMGYAYVTLKAQSVFVVPENGELYVRDQHYPAYVEALPGILDELQSQLEQTEQLTEAEIEAAVHAAFQPVYNNIPVFLDQHYTVVGEYRELLAAAAQDHMVGNFQRILLEETGFEARMDEAVDQINLTSDELLDRSMTAVHERMTVDLNLQRVDLTAFETAITISVADAEARFESATLPVGGAVAAGTFVVVKGVSKKVITKALAKAGAKTAGKAGAAAAAGSTGAAAGLSCGPGAPICSAVLGIGAATIAWLATDKAIVEIDEVLNRENFEAEIHTLLDEARDQVVTDLQDLHRERLELIERINREKLEGARSVKELVVGSAP